MVNYDSQIVQNMIQNGAVFQDISYTPLDQALSLDNPMGNVSPYRNIYGNYNPMMYQSQYNQFNNSPYYYGGYQQGYPSQMMSPNPYNGINNNPYNGYMSPNPYNSQYSHYNNKINPFVDYTNNYINRGYDNIYQGNDINYTIPGANLVGGSNKLITTTALEKMKALDDKYNKILEDRQYNYDNMGYGYYPNFMGGYIDPSLINQYNQEKQLIEEEMTQACIDINLTLSKICHNTLGDIDVNNEEEWNKIKSIYEPQIITIPRSQLNTEYEANEFRDMIDTTEFNREQIWRAQRLVTEEHNRIIPPDSNLEQFFDKAGLLINEIEFEKAKHRSRLALRNKYSRKAFLNYLRSEGDKHNVDINIPEGFDTRESHMNSDDPFYKLFPNLRKEDGWSFEDGTLKLSYPDRLKELHMNEEQNDYNRQRLNFANAVYNKINPHDPRYGGGFIC